jgi:Tol biopolymer transport system component
LRKPAALAGGLLLVALTGCSGSPLRPLAPINQALEQAAGTGREPSLAGDWLALISDRQGREQVALVDLRTNRPVPVPGLNRPDAQPVSVSVDRSGERLAVVRQRDGRTELGLYRRSIQGFQLLPVEPAGVPRLVSLSGDGRLMAVQVSRGGIWQVDLLELP